MDTIRTFIAVEIADEAKQKILKLISCLKRSGADVKWTTKDQMHITLKFLGNIGKDKIKAISDALSIISNNFKSFTTTFSKIGAFPNLRNPAVIWLGIDKGAESLIELNGKIETALEGLGLKKEGRIFKPHLTLGRVKSKKNMPILIRLIEKTSLNLEEETKASELTLFQSILTSRNAIYTKLSIAELRP